MALAILSSDQTLDAQFTTVPVNLHALHARIHADELAGFGDADGRCGERMRHMGGALGKGGSGQGDWHHGYCRVKL